MPWASLASCSASLPTTTPVTITGGGTLDLNNSNQTIGSLASSDSTAQGPAGLWNVDHGQERRQHNVCRRHQRRRQPGQNRRRRLHAHRQQHLYRHDHGHGRRLGGQRFTGRQRQRPAERRPSAAPALSAAPSPSIPAAPSPRVRSGGTLTAESNVLLNSGPASATCSAQPTTVSSPSAAA